MVKAEVCKAKEPFGETACRIEGKARPKLQFDGEKPSGKLSLTCLSTVLFYYHSSSNTTLMGESLEEKKIK